MYDGFHIDWKTWKMGEHFPVRENAGNCEHTGKVREVCPKYWKTEGIVASVFFSIF